MREDKRDRGPRVAAMLLDQVERMSKISQLEAAQVLESMRQMLKRRHGDGEAA